jgi:hypothetical protein
MGVATQEAAQGAARREYMQRLIGAGIQGAAAVTGDVMTRSPDAATGGTGAAAPATPAPAAATTTATTSQAQTAAPSTAFSDAPGEGTAGLSMASQRVQLAPSSSVALGQSFQPFSRENQLSPGGLQLGVSPLGAAGMNRRSRPFSLNLGGR